jgi:hypothetical protein
MAYNISWMIPERLILIEVAEILTAEEIITVTKQYVAMMDAEGKPPVHTLVDARLLTKVDIKVKDLPSLLVGGKRDTRFGWTFIVTHNRFITFLSSMASHLTSSQFKTTETMEEALQTFARLDLTLPQEMLIGA